MRIDLTQTKFMILGERIYITNPNLPVAYLSFHPNGCWEFEIVSYQNIICAMEKLEDLTGPEREETHAN
jgi:hypothetical protein